MLYNLQNPLNVSGKTYLLCSASFIFSSLGSTTLPPRDYLFPSKKAVVSLYGHAIIHQGPLNLLHCKYKLCLYYSKVIANLLVGTWQKKSMTSLISLSLCLPAVRFQGLYWVSVFSLSGLGV